MPPPAGWEAETVVSSLDEFKAPSEPPPPKGAWPVRVEEYENVAVAHGSVPTSSAHPDERTLIEGWGLDPEAWRIIDGTLVANRWQAMTGGANDQVWMYQYKARLERIVPILRADVKDLFRRIRAKRPTPDRPSGELTFLLAIGDTQVGKGDGDGSAGTVDRWRSSLARQAARIKLLRRLGYTVGGIAVVLMGDLRESCTGNYSSQQFTTDLTETEQLAVLEHLIYETIFELVPLADRFDVAAVPGNHGEVRDGGHDYTRPSDNHDVAVVQTVHRGTVQNDNEALSHIRWHYPEGEELTVTLDLSGVRVAFAHGHQFKRGGSLPAAKAQEWWRGQAHNQTLPGSATLLLSAHYHHLLVAQSGTKTHIQIPALDGGSQWWFNRTGDFSPPGMFSCLVGDELGPHNCGWTEPIVL